MHLLTTDGKCTESGGLFQQVENSMPTMQQRGWTVVLAHPLLTSFSAVDDLVLNN